VSYDFKTSATGRSAGGGADTFFPRMRVMLSLEEATQVAGNGMAIVVIGITLVVLPFWLLWNVVGPWAHLGSLAAVIAWWIVWRPIRAYRKARA
jgi:hypothetical protein